MDQEKLVTKTKTGLFAVLCDGERLLKCGEPCVRLGLDDCPIVIGVDVGSPVEDSETATLAVKINN